MSKIEYLNYTVFIKFISYFITFIFLSNFVNTPKEKFILYDNTYFTQTLKWNISDFNTSISHYKNNIYYY